LSDGAVGDTDDKLDEGLSPRRKCILSLGVRDL
jgi:hypothetical protein